MDEKENIIYCSRCGAEMAANSRYCMKCGNLNEHHPDNNKYSKILKKTNVENNYQIGSGKQIFNTSKNKSGVNIVTYKNNGKQRQIFIIVNIVIIAIATLISLIPLFSIKSLNVNEILGCGVLTNFFGVGLFSIFFVSSQILFIKLDEYWWKGLIPFYNYYILSEILFKKGWLFVLLFIPGVNVIYSLVLFYVLGESFGKNGILSAIFSPIMIAVIAFGSSAHNGVYYVVDESQNALEKTYGSYKRFASFSIFLLVLGAIGVIFTNTNMFNGGKDKLSIIGGADIAIKKVSKAVKKGNVYCYDVNNDEISITNDGEYYFYSEDFLNDYSFNSYLVDGSVGYVKVVNENGKYKYYVSYTTGSYGIVETEKDELDVDIVERNVKVEEPYGNKCTID